MPVIKSAIKKLKQSLKHRAHNRSVKSGVKELVDKFKKSPTAEGYSKAVSALDKAAKNNIIHPNKAARLKSRLAKRLSKSGTKSETKVEKKIEKKAVVKKSPTKKAPVKKATKKS